ncbi:MAG TPA: ABC transporter permease subunit [Candidatus Limnocylindria bacterium]|nr:ABC transporter permease subunit [Candidatus Limnocylindria bacterium]
MRTRVLSLLVVLVAWQIGSLLAGELVLPSPVTTISRFGDLMAEGRLPRALVIGLQALAIGGGAAVLVGIPLGIILGVRRRLGQAFDFYFSALYVTPFSAVAPLFVLWFGIDAGARMIFIFFFTLPQIVIVCYQGARSTPDRLIEVARSYQASGRDVFLKTILPYEVPFIFTALRLGVGRAVQGMVIAELLISATQGLGFLITVYGASLDIAAVLAVVLFIMLIGIVASLLVQRLEDAIAPWRHGSSTSGEGSGA